MKKYIDEGVRSPLYLSFVNHAKSCLSRGGFWVQSSRGLWYKTLDPKVVKEKLSIFTPEDKKEIRKSVHDGTKKQAERDKIRRLVASMNPAEIKQLAEELRENK